MPLFEADKNNKIAVNQIRKMVINTSKGVKISMIAMSRNLVPNAQELIKNPPKTGRFYRIKVNGQVRLHQASAPGEAPANLTGKLSSGISRRVAKNEIEFGVQGVKWARGLELGRTKGVNKATSSMEPRPYLIKAINAESKNALVILKFKIAEALTNK